MRHIVFTDSHITEKSIPELEKVFTEVLSHTKEAPILVCVGDYYDRKNPSASEIEFGTRWAIKFRQAFKLFYMVTGNHPDIDGKISSVSYLEHLGVVVVPELSLDGTYYGHYTVKESLCGFNEKTEGAELTAKYKLSVLGHQHTFQQIDYDFGRDLIVHPGSCRYVDFGEVTDKGKYILLVDDCTYLQIRLNKVRQMREVTSCSQLKGIPSDYMVRVVINNFKQFLLETDELKKWESSFFDFKVKLDFTNDTVADANTPVGKDNKEIISTWVNSIKSLEVKDEIIKELTLAGLC